MSGANPGDIRNRRKAMQSWITEIGAIIQHLSGNPDSAIEKGVIIFVALVACVIVQLVAAKMLRMTMVNIGRATAVMGGAFHLRGDSDWRCGWRY